MAEAQLQQFLTKVAQLNAFVSRCQSHPDLLQTLRDCSHHQQVVDLAQSMGYDIGRRWGDSLGSASKSCDNLLAGAIPAQGQETSQILIETGDFRLLRLHSCSACSPPGFWYDQAEAEWLCMLQGSARLQFADENVERELNRGDSLMIAPHRRHRLVATDGGGGTIWLALFWTPDSGKVFSS
ncbi:MAG: Nif11 domain/cupin domain-containing protein [Cyanobacteria bacterium]|nr:Nif11 domain/cupin domain-containing protein [Cyanobacteriota bacterium]